MKLAFLGPAAPFRGGIVTYYGMLARILADRGHRAADQPPHQQIPHLNLKSYWHLMKRN